MAVWSISLCVSLVASGNSNYQQHLEVTQLWGSVWVFVHCQSGINQAVTPALLVNAEPVHSGQEGADEPPTLIKEDLLSSGTVRRSAPDTQVQRRPKHFPRSHLIHTFMLLCLGVKLVLIKSGILSNHVKMSITSFICGFVFIWQEELDESGAPPLKKICTGENAVLR